MHPVYMTLGNIHKSLRRKRDSRAWLVLAKLPTGRFRRTQFGTNKAENTKMPGILRERLFHQCMRVVLEPLRKNQRVCRVMVGPDAKLRRCVVVLMAWIADLEEQLLIAGVVKFHCPVCVASKKELGDLDCFCIRSGKWILDTLACVRAKYPNATTYEFSCAIRSLKIGLSGCTEELCWEGLLLGPERFIKQDLLHGSHKFLWDHLMTWLCETLGCPEIDSRYRAQPPIDDVRHFADGISKLSQVSGCEHREVQKVLVPLLYTADAAPGNHHVLLSTRHLIDYIYTAQFPEISESDITRMRDALISFHRHKDIFIQNGSRDPPHFQIPKLHALPHLIDDARRSGAPDNFSTETPESLHIENCKEPWRASNKHDVDDQILNYLTIKEKISLRVSYESWKLSGQHVNPLLVCAFVV